MFHRTRKPTFAPPIVIVGTAEEIRDFLCRPQQHNEHCKGWKWHQYIGDNEKRMENVMAKLRRIHAERRATEPASID